MDTVNQSETIKNVACVLSVFPGSKWVAFHVEYDFVTQGKTRQLAMDAMERLIMGQIHLDTEDGIEPLSEISKWSDYD